MRSSQDIQPKYLLIVEFRMVFALTIGMLLPDRRRGDRKLPSDRQLAAAIKERVGLLRSSKTEDLFNYLLAPAGFVILRSALPLTFRQDCTVSDIPLYIGGGSFALVTTQLVNVLKRGMVGSSGPKGLWSDCQKVIRHLSIEAARLLDRDCGLSKLMQYHLFGDICPHRTTMGCQQTWWAGL